MPTTISTMYPVNGRMIRDDDSTVNIAYGYEPVSQVFKTTTINLTFLETTTNLGAGATFTGPSRDLGSPSTYSKLRSVIAHGANNMVGHLQVQQSTDNTTWRTTHITPIAGDNKYRTLEFAVDLRYARCVFVNGSTAQSNFFLNSTYTKGENSNMSYNTLTFVEPTTIQAASATYASPVYDLGSNHGYKLWTGFIVSDSVGSLQVQESKDGTVWRAIQTSPVSANSPLSFSINTHAEFFKIAFVNGATAQTAIFDLVHSFTD